MYSIAICDDELHSLKRISQSVKDILKEEGIHYCIQEYTMGETLLSDIRNGMQFQLLLLDVMMDSMNGIELASILREQKDKTAIVFISYNREMALYGYEVSATRFLAKPLEKEKLKEALLYCYHSVQEKKSILLPTKKGQCRIHFSDMIYAEAWERGARIVLSNGTEDVTVKFAELETMLPAKQFILCHRAYLVNLSYVKYIRSNELELKTGSFLPISKLRKNEIQQKFMSYLED